LLSDAEQSRDRCQATDNSLSVAAAASSLHSGGAEHRNDTSQSYNNKKRQHLPDAIMSRKTPKTDDSRKSISAVPSSAQRSEDAGSVHDESNTATAAVLSSTHHIEDAGSVHDESNTATAAVLSSTHHIEGTGRVHDESNTATAAVLSSTHHIEDAGSVHDESNTATAAVLSSTHHIEDAGSVHDVSNTAMAPVESSSSHSEDAGSVHDVDGNNTSAATAAALSSTQHKKQRETVCALSGIEQHIVTTVETAATEMQSTAGCETLNVENSVLPSCANDQCG